jgi:hypothetical protein
MTHPIRWFENLINSIQNVITNYNPDIPDIFNMQDQKGIDAVSISLGLYKGSQNGEFSQFGLFGSIGAGSGTPNLSIGIESIISNQAPDVILTGAVLEMGLSAGPAAANVITNTELSKVLGASVFIGPSILPVDLHAFQVTGGIIPIYIK